ncbi:hypothetical protein DY000_02024583 [Brassica cretica]|uniref:DDE-1 domain-containing protein n=1 Tax=Brassica cretica TaxID=69181 RepID=A0ABQ7EFA4_BRACR|nr:hypothetical protein DY000_02024583 [Brassica cretica]
MFNGSVLREWIYHCEQLFSIDSTLPELKNIFPLWPEYVAAVLARIGELYDDPLSELVSLKQGNDTIEIYLEKLYCAANRITLALGHALKAARIAKLHELSIQHTLVRTLPPTFNSSRSNFSQPNKNQFSTSTPPTTNAVGNQNNKPPPLQHTSETGHQLKHRRAEFLFLEADTEFDEEIALEEQIRATTLDEDNKIAIIFVQALNGTTTFNCIRLMSQYGKRKLHILIDSCSTHNFLDVQIAKSLGCTLIPTKPTLVVAASRELITKYKSSVLSWKMQGDILHISNVLSIHPCAF